jgi:hypothetical protein
MGMITCLSRSRRNAETCEDVVIDWSLYVREFPSQARQCSCIFRRQGLGVHVIQLLVFPLLHLVAFAMELKTYLCKVVILDALSAKAFP